MTPMLLIGLIGLLIFADERGKTKPRQPGPEVPIGPGAEMFDVLEGYLAYKPEYATELIRALLYRYVVPTEQTNVLMVLPGDGQAIGPAEGGAYYGLQHAHDDRYVIWVRTDFHWPQSATSGQFVVVLPEGEAPPENYAILILPDEQWPPLTAGMQQRAA